MNRKKSSEKNTKKPTKIVNGKKIPDNTIPLKDLEPLFRSLEMGVSIRSSCYIAGITETTYHLRYKKDEEFRKMCDMAIAKSEYNVVGKLMKAINKGNVKAIMFFLERRHSEQWGAKTESKIEIEPKSISLEELKESRKRAEEALRVIQKTIYNDN